MSSAEQLYNKGDALFQKGKYREATRLFDQAIALDNKFMPAYRGQFRCYNGLGEQQKISDWCDKALAVDPTYQYGLNSKGLALSSMGRIQEAIEYFDKAIELYPDWDFPYSGRGGCLKNLGRYNEAIKSYKKSLELNPNEPPDWLNVSLCFEETNRYEEAKEALDKAIALSPNNALYLCSRGRLFNKLGQKAQALEDFKKAHKSLQDGFLDLDLQPEHMEFIKWTLAQVVELDDISAQAEAAVQKADQNNPTVKKFVTSLIKLQEQKAKVTTDLMTKAEKNDTSNNNELIKELEKLKSQFSEIQTQLAKVQTDVKEMKNEIDNVKEELNNKMDNFHKKLDNELKKMDLTPEDQIKVKEYFRAFVETFSSAHVTAQVVDSGQVQLDTESTQASILSLVASLTPFVGNVLSSGITTLSSFFQSKEMKTSARKLKGLAVDATELSQLIGKSGYEIVMNKQKQEQIIAITNADLKMGSDILMEKITQFCDNLNEELDAYLYSRLYKTPSARLGNNDANLLIEQWIRGNISHYAVEEEFIKNATNLNNNEKPKDINEVVVESVNPNTRDCCNLF